eukprot:CAMPEP_0202970320 /NCGR_PEP_ID=MMETSP1396-20130829/16282_1 /ASSEMBLY_ACC=CAM_ASM_000872 /TAXON_ID= /ORGANISM="Pseudokeronopsis sp., Strain Brazil" /LENGTH=253 /DNA_ID=CAMNT_0049698735 /DNA_START=59 /DNA_END=820 /DNA_ORIENTATION=-
MQSCPDYLLAENQLPTEENISLYHASKEGNLSEIERLLTLGAKPNFFLKPEEQKNALHVAAENGHTVAVRTLLENGAAVDSLSAANQNTALNYAASCALVGSEMINILVEYGADPNHANAYGNTPLHESCLLGNLEVTRALIGHGASVRAQNHHGSTPLHSLSYCKNSDTECSVAIAEMLVAAGAAVDSIDSTGQTPFLVAASMGNEQLVRWLLNQGANSHATDDHGRNAVGCAQFYGKDSIVKLLSEMYSHK